MSRKKKKEKAHRPKGQQRLEIILALVKTDSTFEVMNINGEQVWVGKCLHCSRKLSVSMTGDTLGTVEHIVPLSGGGNSDLINLALACGSCNSEKGIKHDPHYGSGGRADEIIATLQRKRLQRWRDDASV